MAQTRTGSVAESAVNIVVGFAINWTANMLVLPMFGFSTITAAKAFGIGLVFTLISFARQYLLRRWANCWKWAEESASAPTNVTVSRHVIRGAADRMTAMRIALKVIHRKYGGAK